jgi:hypothetical protein
VTVSRAGEEVIAARVERAREIAKRFETRSEIVAAFVHGSSMRPYGDDQSDLDIWLMVDDGVLGTLSEAELYAPIWEGGRKLADIKVAARTDVCAPVLDIGHFRAVHARVLFDKTGTLAENLRSVAEVPAEIRETRMRLHYFEATLALSKVTSALKRNKPEIGNMVSSLAAVSALKVLSFFHGAWPPPISWSFEELELLEVSGELLGSIRKVLLGPTPAAMRMMRGQLDGWLIERDISFVKDPGALVHWLFDTSRGRDAQERWGWMVKTW